MKRGLEAIDNIDESVVGDARDAKRIVPEFITFVDFDVAEQKAFSRYYRSLLSKQQADDLFDELYSLKGTLFKQEVVNTPGGKKLAPRLTAAFGDANISYKYAGVTQKTIPEYPKLLLECQRAIESLLGCSLNYAFVNIYEITDSDGKPCEHYIGWHSDDEPQIVLDDTRSTTICSVSLGDERTFQIRRAYKPPETPTQIHSIMLHHGSLCTMEKQTQLLCKHQVPKKKNATKVRINITFRLMHTEYNK